MYAAVVTSFNAAPRLAQMDAPEPHGEHQVLVDVLASGLHPRVRSQANGSHYTSTDQLPLVPGIDGVGRLSDGRIVYFILPDTTMGAMAEQTVIDLRRSFFLANDLDPVMLAAAILACRRGWGCADALISNPDAVS